METVSGSPEIFAVHSRPMGGEPSLSYWSLFSKKTSSWILLDPRFSWTTVDSASLVFRENNDLLFFKTMKVTSSSHLYPCNEFRILCSISRTGLSLSDPHKNHSLFLIQACDFSSNNWRGKTRRYCSFLATDVWVLYRITIMIYHQ